MQAAGTLRGTRAISLLVLLVPLTGYVYSSPLQYLPNIPGYIPVYIRHGDEPLESINPELAEAFGETSNSAKSLQPDYTLAHASDSFKDNDIDALLEESKSKHAYPLRVRAAESRSFATVNDGGNERNKNPNRPKLLNIYELPDDNENRPRRRHRNRARTRNENWKAPAFKVSPLSDAEKEELEKLAIEVEKEETKPNDLYVPNSKYPELPSAGAHNRRKHNRHNFVAPTKVQNPIDESSMNGIPQPEVLRGADLSKSLDNITTSEANKEPAIKNQRPATILSNVDKISPIDLPDESDINEDNKMKNSTEPNDEIAIE